MTKLVRKYFLTLMGGGLFLIAILTYSFWTIYERESEETSQAINRGAINIVASALSRDLWSLVSDVKQLGIFAEAELTSGPFDESNLGEIEAEFLKMAEAKIFYDQIRFLSPEGKEISHINNASGAPSIVPKEQLQDKSNMEYVRIGKTLKPDTFYLSPIHLNRKFGEIEQPLKPMVRAIYPVYGGREQFLGLVIINYNINNILYSMQEIFLDVESSLHMTDMEGFWVYSPNRAQEWGRDLETGAAFPLVYPEAWEAAKSTKEGIFERYDQYIYFRRIHLLPSIDLVNQDSPLGLLEMRPHPGGVTDYMLFAMAPHQTLWGLITHEPMLYGLMGFFLLAFVSGGSYLGAGMLAKRRDTMRELAERESYMRAVTDTLVDALIVINHRGIIQSFNHTAEKMFGYAEKDVRGKNVRILMPEEYARDHDQHLEDYLDGHGGTLIGKGPRELMAKRKNGSLFNIELAVSALKAKKGALFIGSIRDTTEKKKAENTLRERDKYLHEIFQNIESLIIVLDPLGRIVQFNPACEKTTGFKEDEVKGKYFYDLLLPPDLMKTTKAEFKRLVETKQAGPFVNQWLAKNGSRKDLQWNSFALTDANGNLNYVVGTGLDITDAKKTQDRLKLLAEEGTDLVALHNPNGEIKYISPAVEKILGYKPGEFLNLKPTDFIVFEDLKQTVITRRRVVRDKRQSSPELYRAKRKDGGRVWLEIMVKPILGKDGNVEKLITSSRDVTSRIEIENQLRQSQRMEAIGNLTGGIAHDFNNLLTAVIGSLSLVDSHKNMNKMDKECFDIALTAAKRGGELTHRLLAFSRNQTLNPKTIDVNKLLTDLEKLLPRVLREDVNLEIHPSEDSYFTRVDPAELESCLINLSINAKDAMPDGGRLVIEASRTLISGPFAEENKLAPGQYVVISVTDSGTGMNKEVLAKVFEPFFTTKGVGKGTGLGLAMVYGFIKQSGGLVTVYSEVGKGSTFKLYLPESEAKTTSSLKEITVPKKYSGKGKTILLVEDDELIRDFATLALKDAGYKVLVAKDGPTAITIIRKEKNIDLLLTDVVLPNKMDGIEVAAIFKNYFPDTPVIYSSGYTSKAEVTKERLPKGYIFLPKPYDLKQLFDTVAGLLAGNK